jgi:hypothetical protein
VSRIGEARMLFVKVSSSDSKSCTMVYEARGCQHDNT